MEPSICAHLQPLVHHLRGLGIEVTPCESPYGPGPYTWWNVPCVFEGVKALRSRLGIAKSVEYEENFAFAMGADATWTCKEHKIVLLGPHPKVTGSRVPRVR
jgi:hypothetical protein